MLRGPLETAPRKALPGICSNKVAECTVTTSFRGPLSMQEFHFVQRLGSTAGLGVDVLSDSQNHVTYCVSPSALPARLTAQFVGSVINLITII